MGGRVLDHLARKTQGHNRMTHEDAAPLRTVDGDDEAEGLRLYEALREEARARVRALLMTTV